MSQIEFSGYTWNVSESHGEKRGPGPNIFSADNVYVDGQDNLHLRIAKQKGIWASSEVLLEKPVGYGDYDFFVIGDFTQYDSNVVAGLFLYKDDKHELDIEFARWGNPAEDPIQYVVQPQRPETIHRFNSKLNGTYSSHRISWSKREINFRSFHGHHTDPEIHDFDMQSWKVKSPYQPTGEHAMINFWLAGGQPPQDEKEVELVIARFSYQQLLEQNSQEKSSGNRFKNFFKQS